MSAPRFWFVLTSLAYVALLNLTYEPFLLGHFESVGYAHRQLPPLLVWMPWTLGMIPALLLPLEWTRPSQLVCFVLYVLLLVPATVIPFYGLRLGPERAALLATVLTASFVLLILVGRLTPPAIPRPSGRAFVWIVGAMWIGLAAYAACVFEFPRTWPGLGGVYLVRQRYEAAVEAHRGPVAYAVLWLAEVLHPLLIAAGLAWPRLSAGRRAALVAAGLVGQGWIFSITGFRSVLMSWVPLAGVALLLRRRAPTAMMALLVAAFVGSLALARWGGVTTPADLLVRRTLANPGMLTGLYFEFFSENPKARLGHSVLRRVVDYPYDTAPPQLVSRQYLPRSHGYASANLWADGYANFGFAGILGATLLLGAILWIFDGLARGRPAALITLMLCLPAYVLAESGLLTCLMSHGLGLTLLLAWLLPPQTEPHIAPPTG